MDKLRGVLMIGLSGICFYQGWASHGGQRALLAYGVGVLAVAMGIWRLTRKPRAL